MSLGALLLLHLMAGAGVAGAVYLSGRGRHAGGRFLRVATALLFWPLYLPILLAGGTPRSRLPGRRIRRRRGPTNWGPSSAR